MSFDHIVLFDMEMCCNAERTSAGDIIQIALVDYDLKQRSIIRQSNYYITPNVDIIEPYCTGLTGITQSFIDKNGKPLSKVIQSIKNRYGSSNVVYGCWGEDVEYLNRYCVQYNINSPIRHSINIAMLYLLKKQHTSTQKIGLQSALQSIGKRFEGKAHNALTDTLNLIPLVDILL